MSSSSTPASLRKTIRVVVAVAGALIAFLVIRSFLPGGPGGGGDRRSVLERPWERTEALGLTFESPSPFRPVTIPVPESIRTSILRMENWGRNVGDTEMRVSRIEYNPGVPLNLEGSAQGTIDGLRPNPAISGLTHAYQRTQVSGVPAIRSLYDFKVQGRDAHGETLTLLRDRTVWQVHVIGPRADAALIARRLIPTVQLAPADP